jgi:hypothetical protein
LDQLACVRATSAAAAELQRTSPPRSERAADFDFWQKKVKEMK